jgi:GTPase SAR1 family protein
MYFKQIKGAVLVYSVTDLISFSNIRQWVDDLHAYNKPDTFKLFIVGNKADCEEDRCISYVEGVKEAQKYNATFFEVSAKTGLLVTELFQRLGDEIIRLISD